MAEVWLRYRDESLIPALQLREAFSHDGLLQVSQEKKDESISGGEKFMRSAIADHCRFISEAVIEGGSDVDVRVQSLTAVLMVFVYCVLRDYDKFPVESLANATVELARDKVSGAAAMHISLPNNFFEQSMLSFSVTLDAFFRSERLLQNACMTIVGKDLIVVDDLIRIYENVLTENKRYDEKSFAAMFLASVMFDIAPACSLILGGRFDAGRAIARRSLEILGVTQLIMSDDHSAQIWAEAHLNDQAWQKFKKHFEIWRLFPKGDHFWASIFTIYDKLARSHHPNPESFTRNRFVSVSSGKLTYSVGQLDFDVSEFASKCSEFFEILDLYAMILGGFLRIFKRLLPIDFIRSSTKSVKSVRADIRNIETKYRS